MKNYKISIITVCYNSVATIEETIRSVLSQTYQNIEYVIIDGKSTDGTIDILNKYKEQVATIVSEKDNGLYDAMNKGIKAATGDIIGILNSDDYFNNPHVISTIAAAFQQDETLDATIGDIVFVNSQDKVIRHYSAKNWKPEKFAWGYMPPHPSFFAKKDVFDRLGFYKLDYKIAADYELLIRYFSIGKINWKYLPLVTTRMRLGGKSTKNLRSTQILNAEILRGCKENNVYSNYLMIYSKYFKKPFEFLFKNKAQ